MISLSCLPALLCRPPWLDSVLLRGVKNLVNRFGVTVGGFLGLSVLEARSVNNARQRRLEQRGRRGFGQLKAGGVE